MVILSFSTHQTSTLFVSNESSPVPMESVQIKNGLIYVNNIESPFQRPDTYISYSGTATDKIQMSNEQYFVIGDNYEHSTDSRYSEIGIISCDNIIGKVVFPFISQ